MYSVGIYARLSVDGGEKKNESIETQIEIAKEYMKRQGDMVLYGCYTEMKTAYLIQSAGTKCRANC